MQVITTHLNADFDCFASMVAAQKLYPDARMVFSGSAEKTVNEYMKRSKIRFDISRHKDIDLDRVELLVLVDTQDPERIGDFKSVAQKPEVEVHVFDHHPDVVDKVRADQATIRKRGSATTILVEVLAEKNIALSPEESTLMALGIYQDTQSLLSPSTTAEDFAALDRLMRMGADLNVVSDYIKPRLNQEQLDVLNDLIRNLETVNFNGIEIALATASVDYYVEDLAYVVHRVMSLENLQAMFALIRLEHRVYLIGRSRTEAVDVAEVARTFGGGGHVYAASATTRDQTLVQVKEKLLELLPEKVRSPYLVQDIMHYPVVSVRGEDPINTVEKTLTRFNLNTLPVVEDDRPVGLITRQIVEKAIHHKMAYEKTEDFMIREYSVITPESYFKTIVPFVIEEKQKLIPVVGPENGHLVGVVSRGDLLRVLHGDMARQRGEEIPMLAGKQAGHKNIKSLLKERLDKPVIAILETIAKVGDRVGVSVYVVGGFVRDLLLRIDNLDIDIVVEGDGIPFAKTLAEQLGARVKSHAKFGTSVIIREDGFRIDVATARLEYYKHPGALPTVEKSSIKADLLRRDFTINALAIKLNNRDPFCLIDFFNGERDLKDGVIRVLHNLSFIEDPCRMFRAIRFEQRFRFKLGKQTQAFMKNAIEKKLVDRLSPTRLLNELIQILKEENPIQCVRRMIDVSLFQFVSPTILEEKESVDAMERIEEVLTWAKMVPLPKQPEVWFVYFIGLFCPLDEKEFTGAVDRLRLPQRLRSRLEADCAGCKEARRRLALNTSPEPEQVYNIFSGLSPEAVIYLLSVSASDRANKLATLYFTQYHSQADLALNGKDLIELGVEPGPIFQTVFKSLREARLKGKVKSRKDEVALVEKEFLCR